MTCLKCGATLPRRQNGKGRQRTKYCSTKCKSRDHSARQYARIRASKPRRTKPLVPAMDRHFERDWHTRLNEMLRRGECAVHLQTQGHRLLVTEHNWPMFVFDHIDRHNKTGIVSRLIGRYADPMVLINEMNKCQLICANCHYLKTYVEKDFQPVQVLIDSHPQLQLAH